MVLQDYLDEKIAIKCSSEVEINSMLYIIKQMGDEKFIEDFKEARKKAESNGSTKPFFIFFRKGNANYCLIDIYTWNYKVVDLTKELYKEMKKELENKINFTEKEFPRPRHDCSCNLIVEHRDSFLNSCLTTAKDFNNNITTVCVDNYKLKEEKEMINLDGFLNKYKEMVEEKLMKERKEKVKKLKEKDCYIIQIKKIKDTLIDSFNALIKDNEEGMDLICDSDVHIIIKNELPGDFVSKETKEKLAKIENEELEKIKELDSKIKEIKTACMLSTSEEKIQQILTSYKFITEDGKIRL